MRQAATNFTLLLLLSLSLRSYGYILTQALPFNEKPQLMILNASELSSSFWIQHRNLEKITEDHVKIEANSSLTFDYNEWSNQGNAVSIKTLDKELKAFFVFSNQRRIELTSQAGLSFKFKSMTSDIRKIHILNLNSEPQTVEILLDNKISIKKITSNYYDTISFEISDSQNIEIKSSGRISVISEDSSGYIAAEKQTLTFTENELPKQGHFFLVSSDSLQDSFVVHLTNEELIKEAQQAAKMKSSKILVADIISNLQIWNRAFTGNNSTPWSWSVEKVHSFSDIAHISCDGSASLVEERLLSWLIFGRICFWKSHVIKELSIEEVLSGVINNTPSTK